MNLSVQQDLTSARGSRIPVSPKDKEILIDNQRRVINGYRELTIGEIAIVNIIKAKGVELRMLVETLREMPEIDKRWVSIGATDLQTGLMALVRSVTKPESF